LPRILVAARALAVAALVVIASAGGRVFIGATTDKFVRAFDARNGAELWRVRLPFPPTQHRRPIACARTAGRSWWLRRAATAGRSPATPRRRT